jgi:hypothetical protein
VDLEAKPLEQLLLELGLNDSSILEKGLGGKAPGVK